MIKNLDYNSITYDDVIEKHEVIFYFFNKICYAYFDSEEEAKAWIDFVDSKTYFKNK